MSPVIPFSERPQGDVVCLFDVDGTLTPARRVSTPIPIVSSNNRRTDLQTPSISVQTASPEILEVLKQVRAKAVIGFVGGSDLPKITEQLAVHGQNSKFENRSSPERSIPNSSYLRGLSTRLKVGAKPRCDARTNFRATFRSMTPGSNLRTVTDDFDFCFAENGLTAIKLGQELDSASFIKFIGEEKYKKMVRFILHYIADLDIPVKRGTFIEFRNGMINVSPIGRNASVQERDEFEKYDKESKVRATFVEALKKEFADYGLTYSIGGQISFDVFPNGWDKTYALQHIEKENFKEIHFFGDKTYKGGNDYEIYEDKRTIGHAVQSPADTIRELKTLFKL